MIRGEAEQLEGDVGATELLFTASEEFLFYIQRTVHHDIFLQ
jgi:hypothetical protein